MKRLKIYMFCLMVSVGTITCKKEHLPAPSNGAPVFSFTGLVGGVAMNLQAGVNNYYMYSSYTQDSGVYSYTANLKEFNCTNSCPPSIEFIINDYRSLTSGASETNISTALDTGYFNYLIPGGTPTAYSVSFVPTFGTGATITSFAWNFGDGTPSIISYSITPVTHTYSRPGNYNASLSVLFGDSETGSLSNALHLGGDTNSPLNCTIISDSSASFSANVYGGIPPYSYSWSNNPSTKTSSASYAGIYSNDTSIFTVTLTVTDNIGNSVTATTYGATSAAGATQAAHLMNYSISAPVPNANPNGLSNVTIIYTNASGDRYTSNYLSSQPDSSYFHITSVSNYRNNENNQTTKQLHVKFNCTLFDGNGNTLTINNGNAVIAVAYK